MKLSASIVLAAVVVAGIASSVFATEYWVDPVSGSDDFDGRSDGCAGGDSLVGPKKTLAGVMEVATKKGDIVYAAEGEYREGTMGSGTTLDRVRIPAGVSLIGAGPGKSFIIGEDAPLENQCEGAYGCGTGAVRCVQMMGDDTLLKGFTICNGRVHCTKWGNSGGDTVNRYAGVMAYHNGSMGYPGRSVIVDCIISNCVANTCAVSRDGLFINCRVVDCRVGWYTGMDNPIVYNCYFDNITSTYTLNSPLLVMNCTFGATKTNIRMQGVVKHVYNSVFLGTPVYSSDSRFVLHNCRYKGALCESCDGSDGSQQMAVEAMQLGSDGMSPLSTSPLLDQGSTEQYFNNTNVNEYSANAGWDTNCNWYRRQIQQYANVDLNGNPRVQNGAIDLGCVEYDRREEYAKALALERVEVTDVSSNVFKAASGEVELRDEADSTSSGFRPPAATTSISCMPRCRARAHLSSASARRTRNRSPR